MEQLQIFVNYNLMENNEIIIRIKRRLSGDPGPPPILDTGELAFNEADDTLYIGVSQQNPPLSGV